MQDGHSVTERVKVYLNWSWISALFVTNESLFAIPIRRILGLKLQRMFLKGKKAQTEKPTEAALLSSSSPGCAFGRFEGKRYLLFC